MAFFIGADLGTSGLKLLLVDEIGEIKNSVTKEYPLSFPHPGWSEQMPDDWWSAFLAAVPELLIGFDAAQVSGIGIGGQMHGLVVLSKDNHVLRPAILWNDGRTQKQTDYLNNVVGKENLSQLTANIAFTGFTAPKLLWIKQNEPEIFAQIDKIMLPKDFLVYRLTGIHTTDYSDASGTLLLDVEHKCWSRKMMEICGVMVEQLPRLCESWDSVGTILPEIAELLGLPAHVVLCAGAGDNAAAAIGTGTIGEGRCNISLGTSGTVFISSTRFAIERQNALHSFAHADGGWHLMGCILSAASCNKWWLSDIINTSDYVTEQKGIAYERLGENHVWFLPYLMGERSPHNDPTARGCFLGLSMDSTRSDMTQAVLEGVAFAIRDCVEAARNQGIEIEKSMICGGGAKSSLWQEIIVNVLNIPLELPATEQGPGFGAAMLAMVACGAYPCVETCAETLIHTVKSIVPAPILVEKYESRYQKWRRLYPQLKPLFVSLQ